MVAEAQVWAWQPRNSKQRMAVQRAARKPGKELGDGQGLRSAPSMYICRQGVPPYLASQHSPQAWPLQQAAHVGDGDLPADAPLPQLRGDVGAGARPGDVELVGGGQHLRCTAAQEASA